MQKLEVVLALPCFAASGMTKAQLLEKVGKIPAEYQAQATSVINAMSDATAANVNYDAVKAVAQDLAAKKAAGTLTVADITGAKSSVEAAAPGLTVALGEVSVSDGKVSAIFTANVDGKSVSIPYNISDNTAGNNGVIKATGFGGSVSVLVLMMAMAGVLGPAVIKMRKARACA